MAEGDNLDQQTSLFSMTVDEYDLNGNIELLTRKGIDNQGAMTDMDGLQPVSARL
jgi:hypothetical protein